MIALGLDLCACSYICIADFSSDLAIQSRNFDHHLHPVPPIFAAKALHA
jgi:hypothetical protein